MFQEIWVWVIVPAMRRRLRPRCVNRRDRNATLSRTYDGRRDRCSPRRPPNVCHPETFRAYVAEQLEAPNRRPLSAASARFDEADLPPGEVEIRVDWSSVNFKDGLATRVDGQGRPDQPADPGDRPGRGGDRERGSGDLRGPVRAGPRLRPRASRATAATPSTSGCRPAGSCRWRPGLRRGTRW